MLYDLGQYRFGPEFVDGSGRPWLKELAYYTTRGSADGVLRDDQVGNSSVTPDVKVADDHGWDVLERQGVFNISDQQKSW